MQTPTYPTNILSWIKTLTLDLVAVLMVYFTPALSHLLTLPLYYLEPIRMMIVLAIVHTSRTNAYILALTLPFFSWLTSAHPDFLKMILITVELTINVSLFYWIYRKSDRLFLSMLGSILLSKILYYLAKFLLINLYLIQGKLIGTPIIIQLFTGIIFSAYLALVFRKSSS